MRKLHVFKVVDAKVDATREEEKKNLLGVIGENIRYPTAFLVHFEFKHKPGKEKVSCTGQDRVMCDTKIQDNAQVTLTRTPPALHPGQPS